MPDTNTDFRPDPTDESEERPDPTGANRGISTRVADSQEVYRRTHDHRATIREYCRGNKWLEENAKAVGNW